MKIEIAESLALSYLKHVHQCVFYQTNWKASSQWEKFNEEDVESLFENIKNDPEFAGVCKQTSNYSQFLKQAEIDAIGLDMSNIVYAIDTAFHENGLNYGSSEETADRIMKKLLRTYLIVRTYFPDKKYKLIFASPKVGKTQEALIEQKLKELERIVENSSVEFIFLSNEEFKTEFIDKTLEYSMSDSDTAELFLRSIRLYELVGPRDRSQRSARSEAIQAVEAGSVTSERESLDDFLEFYPHNEKLFKEKLIEVKRAKRTWIYSDGRQVHDTWNARYISADSNLRGNIASNNKVRIRKELGLVKLILEIEE